MVAKTKKRGRRSGRSGADSSTCLSTGCCERIRCRGLCESCYFAARRLIKTGKVSGWEWLVRNGLASPLSRTSLANAVAKKLRSNKRRKATKVNGAAKK